MNAYCSNALNKDFLGELKVLKGFETVIDTWHYIPQSHDEFDGFLLSKPNYSGLHYLNQQFGRCKCYDNYFSLTRK